MFIALILSIGICIGISILMKMIFTNKEGLGFKQPDNLMNELKVEIPVENDNLKIPNQIVGFRNKPVELNALNVTNKTIHKGNLFINPFGDDLNPDIDLAFGDKKTGFNREDTGIVSFWGNGEKMGSFGTNGITLQKNKPFEFGKDIENKNGDAGKIIYTTTGLEITGAGNQGINRKVRIQDNLDVGNNLTVKGQSDLNSTRLNGNNRIIGDKRLEFGASTPKTQSNSGTIIYKSSLDPNALNLVGAETENESKRKVHLRDDVEIEGNLFIKGRLNVGQDNQVWSLHSETDGQYHFLYNNIDPVNQDPNTGHIILSKDGDIWVAQSNYRGWVTEGEKTINDNINMIRAARLEAERIKAERDRSDQKDNNWLDGIMNFANIFISIGDKFAALGDAIGGAFEGLGNGVKVGFDTVGADMTQGFDVANSNVKAGFDTVSSNVTAGFEDSTKNIAAGLDIVGTNVTSGLDTAGNSFKNVCGEAIPKTIKNVVADMTGGFDVAERKVKQEFDDTTNTIKNGFSDTTNTIRNGFNDTTNRISNGFNESNRQIGQWFDELPSKISSGAGSALSGGGDDGGFWNPMNW